MWAKLLLSISCILLITGAVVAAPVLYISATTVPTSFDGQDLVFGNDVLPIVIRYNDGSSFVYERSSFNITLRLISDESQDGIATGVFGLGTFSIVDESSQVLLEGSIPLFTLTEAFDDMGILAGSGLFVADDGLLLANMPADNGTLYNLSFRVKPGEIEDFTGSFSGVSNVTFHPIPEPATLTLLGLGLGSIVLSRRKHRK